MLTRTRARSRLFALFAATVAANAGCDSGGSPEPEPDLTLDAQADALPAHDAARDGTPDAPSEAGDATIIDAASIDAEAVTDAPTAIDAADAAPTDASLIDAEADAATPTVIDAGVDATVEAGTDSGIDASPVVVVDAADGGGIDAALAPVAVMITGPAGPESGVPIVFHDPSGAQLGVVSTDATGAASMVVPPGSMVTAIFGNPNQSTLVSIAAVQPGDVIPVVDPVAPTPVVATTTIHLPDSAPPEGTARYNLSVGAYCGAAVYAPLPSSVSVDIQSNCFDPSGAFPVIAVAEDVNGTPLGFDFKLDNPVDTDGGTPDVFLSGGFSTAFGTETIETANLDPDGMTPAFASVIQIANGPIYRAVQPVVVQDDGSSQTILTLVPGFGSAVQTEIDLEAGQSLVAWVSREAAPAGSGTDVFDLSALPPEITGSSIDASNVETPNVTWQSTSPLSNASSGILLTTSWNGNNADIVQNGTWLLLVPSTATSASPPALSGAVAAYSPVADSEWNASIPPGVVAFGGSLATDYDALRPLVGSILGPFINEGGNNNPDVATLPANGTLAVSVYPFDY